MRDRGIIAANGKTNALAYTRRLLLPWTLLAAAFCPLAATADTAPSIEIRVPSAADAGDAIPADGGATDAGPPPQLPAQSAPASSQAIGEGPQVVVNGAKPSIGRPDIAPIVRVRSTYDDNIYISPTHRESDIYTTAVAGLAIGWGDFRDQLTPLGSFQEAYEGLYTPDNDTRQFLYASYTPGYTFFINHPTEDTVDQDATLAGKAYFGKFSLNLIATYRLFSEALVDAGARVRESQVAVAANATYTLSDRTNVEADFDIITHTYLNDSQIDSSEWIDRNYLNYQLLPKTNVSAGFTLGYLSEEEGSNQIYEQGLVRVNYNTGHQFSGNVFGGVEFREFSELDRTVINPVFGLEVVYEPNTDTQVRLSAARLVTNSAEYVGQNIVNTGFSLTISQQVFRKITLAAQGSYEDYAYSDAGGGGNIQRTDNAFGLQASAAFHVTPYLSVTLAYNYWNNNSTIPLYSFYDDRTTLYFDFLF